VGECIKVYRLSLHVAQDVVFPEDLQADWVPDKNDIQSSLWDEDIPICSACDNIGSH
jgi:hypothetical protein